MLFCFAAAVLGQQDTSVASCVQTSFSVDCRSLELTAVPTQQQWGSHSVENITGVLYLDGPPLGLTAITEISAGGFDACPYTNAVGLALRRNAITKVGARAFANLAQLTSINMNGNAITWMAPTSLDGITRLELLDLFNNQLEAFDYGALAEMTALHTLFLDNQKADISCNGQDRWDNDRAGIAAAVAGCGNGCRQCDPSSTTAVGPEEEQCIHLETGGCFDSPGYPCENYDLQNVAQRCTTSTTTTTTTTAAARPSGGLGGGEIAGITFGAVFAIGLAASFFSGSAGP